MNCPWINKDYLSIYLFNSFVNESLLYFGDGRNNAAFSNPDKEGSFKLLLEDLKPTQFDIATNKIYHPDSEWSRDQPQPPGFFSQRRGRQESLETRLYTVKIQTYNRRTFATENDMGMSKHVSFL